MVLLLQQKNKKCHRVKTIIYLFSLEKILGTKKWRNFRLRFRCVFDVMTTGEVASSDFTAAAHSAQADVLRFDPESLKNRTTTKLRPRDVNTMATNLNGGSEKCYGFFFRRILFALVIIAIIVKWHFFSEVIYNYYLIIKCQMSYKSQSVNQSVSHQNKKLFEKNRYRNNSPHDLT